MANRVKGLLVEVDPGLSPEDRDRLVQHLYLIGRVVGVAEAPPALADEMANRLKVADGLRQTLWPRSTPGGQ